MCLLDPPRAFHLRPVKVPFRGPPRGSYLRFPILRRPPRSGVSRWPSGQRATSARAPATHRSHHRGEETRDQPSPAGPELTAPEPRRQLARLHAHAHTDTNEKATMPRAPIKIGTARGHRRAPSPSTTLPRPIAFPVPLTIPAMPAPAASSSAPPPRTGRRPAARRPPTQGARGARAPSARPPAWGLRRRSPHGRRPRAGGRGPGPGSGACLRDEHQR
jgi:hypothetical protein